MNTPAGLSFVDPATVIAQLSVEGGQKVADFGCGSGFFSFEFAQRVGSQGSVYSLDILPSALEAVASRAKTLNLTNLSVKRANLERKGGSTLGPASMDWVILKDMLFQNEHKDVILEEAARVLKPGGHLLIMEWHPDQSMVGPEKELRIRPEALKALLAKAKLSVSQELKVGGFHYAFEVKKD